MHDFPYRMKFLAYLDRKSLSVAEYNVISMTRYASLPPRTMIRMSHAESCWRPDWLMSSCIDCRYAIASLMERGLLQIVDDVLIRRIEAELLMEPTFGPVSGLPQLGDLDFTGKGGALWHRINLELHNKHDTDYCIGIGEADSMDFFANSEETIRRWIDDDRASGREIVAISDIAPIGRWRNRWWMLSCERASERQSPIAPILKTPHRKT